MSRLTAVLLTLGFVLQVEAQDALPPEKLTLIKRATVLVKTENGETGCTGSGFLIRVDQKTGYLATNNHVIDLSGGQRSRNAPRTEHVEVVFDAGQIGERVVKAEVIAADTDRDLAILKVINVAALPSPIPLDVPTLRETMPILACGFPFGESLATSRKHPSVTISNSRISSVRLNDYGQTSVIQLDGSALNPGNSGGPVVTMDGKLVGVAVAGIPGSGIGFAVPNQELVKLLAGRAGKPAVLATPVDSSTIQLRVEGPLLDPFKSIRGVSIYSKPAISGERPPAPDGKGLWPALASVPVESTIKDGWATGTLRIPRGKSTSIWVQFEYRTAAGVIRDEPLELRLPNFAPGSTEGRYLTGVRNDATESHVVGAKAGLKEVNRAPDRYMGQVVTLDGTLTSGTEKTGGKIVLKIGFDRASRPQNLAFVASPSLAEQIQNETKEGPRLVRVVGSVLAPASVSAPYTIDVDELSFITDDGTVTATFKPLRAPVEKPAAPPAPVAPAPVPAAPEEVAKEPVAEGGSMMTLIAAGLALLVGCSAGGFVLWQRRGKTAPPPTLSVSERLNRRVK